MTAKCVNAPQGLRSGLQVVQNCCGIIGGLGATSLHWVGPHNTT